MSIRSGVLLDAVIRDVQDYLPEKDSFSLDNPWLTYRQFASAYLVKDVVRKWIPSDTRQADLSALGSFTEANNLCKDWKLQLDWEIDRVVIGEIRREIYDLLHVDGLPVVGTFYDLLRSGRPGPGVARGATGTSYYTKFMASPLTSTSLELYKLYRDYSEWIPFLSDAESHRYEKFGNPSIVSGSKCTFVPKTESCSRMVCIEPSLNMYFQLGLADILEARLRRSFGIDLRTQPEVNRSLARQGSVDGTLCTIDLSSASDSVSLRLCEEVLPQWFFELLLQLRSRTTEIAGQSVPLFMMSTMGNGFTFPLQTIIFTALLRACTKVFLPGTQFDGNLSCFGDDLICRREIYDRVKYYLNLLGFRLNTSKSFKEGLFRESCGTDWFNGRPVRPVHVKMLRTTQDIVVTINRLNDWSAMTGIPLRGTIHLLYSQIRPRFRYLVPFCENLDAGLRVPSSYLDRMTFDGNGTAVYRRFLTRPQSIRIKEGSIHGSGKLRDLLYNPCGLYCSFLYGELVEMRISVRHNRVLYLTNVAKVPWWDYWPVWEGGTGPTFSWQQWETAVLINLSNPSV